MAEVWHGSVRAEVIQQGDALVFHSLESGGNAGDLRAFCRYVRQIAQAVPVYLSVDMDNPKKEKLMRLYESFGAKATAVVMEVR